MKNRLSFRFSLSLAVGLLSTTGCVKSGSNASSPAPAPVPPPSQRVVTAASLSANPHSIPAIAQREVIRRQEQLRRADQIVLRADKAMADGDLEAAVSGYQAALDGLPAQ